MRVNFSIKKGLVVTTVVALVIAFAPLPRTTNTALAVEGLDPASYLDVGVKDWTQAAQKLARAGVSAFGIPIPFTSFDSIMKAVVKAIIEQLQKQTLSWVNKGNNGDSFFVRNLNDYINKSHDQAARGYLDRLKSNDGEYCSYYKGELVNAISDSVGIPDFTDNTDSSCAAQDAVGQDAFNSFNEGNFTDGGGWKTWNAITTDDKSNPYGGFLTARDEAHVTITRKESEDREQVDQGNGYESKKDSSGNVITPGNVISQQVNHVLGSDLRQLEQAKTFDDFVTVLVGSVINEVMTNDGGLFKSTGDKGGDASTKYAKPTYPSRGEDDASAGNTSGNSSVAGKATQSSTYTNEDDFAGHDASMALTGSRNRNPKSGVSITKKEENPWWQVDLGKVLPIDHIDITPRIDDGYGDDLRGFYVIISQQPITGDAIPSAGAGVWKSKLIAPARPREDITTVTPPAGTSGQYVRIQMDTDAIGKGPQRLEIAGVEVITKDVPSITLIGSSKMQLTVGQQFVDPGVVAIDPKEGDISDSIITTGTVNTAKAGTYTITYKARNSKGVETATIKRTVIVQ